MLRGPVLVIVLLVQAGFTSVDWLPHRQDAKGILLLRSVPGYRLTTRWNKPGGFSWACILRHLMSPRNANLRSSARDVTSIFDHYRESARAIWNTAFWPDQDFRNWDAIDQFHEIEKILFQELVLAKVDREWPLRNLFEVAVPFFHVVPSIVHGIPIMIQKPRPEAPRGYWDDPVKLVKPGQAELLFMAYFDWNQMDYIDLRYYRVKIASFDTHSGLVGREALIERQHGAIHLMNE